MTVTDAVVPDELAERPSPRSGRMVIVLVIATALALLGPVGFVRRYVRKFAVWIVIASL